MTTPGVTQILRLDDDARLYMLATLDAHLTLRGTGTREGWDEAYGAAADFQTVRDARRELAS